MQTWLAVVSGLIDFVGKIVASIRESGSFPIYILSAA